MWLTNNEKRVLKFLSEDSKLSDTAIAKKINVSSQAIGRIRKKLEESIIKKYTLDVNFKEIGIDIFSSVTAKLINPLKIDKEKVLEKIFNDSNIFRAVSLYGDGLFFGFTLGFKDIHELENFFESKSWFSQIFSISKLSVFSPKSIIKDDPEKLIEKALENLKTRKTKFNVVI